MSKKFNIQVLEASIPNDGAWLQLSAVRAGACVGTATVFWTDVEGKVPELCNLFVVEAARRQGIAAALILAAASRIAGPFCLNSQRETPGYWLYRKLGFLEVGAVGGKEGSVWMVSANLK